MIRWNGKKGKLNNKGFSLVEVLVAMMIMAVVSIPIMKCFTTGAVINSKARERQRESTVAQSIMEGLKAYTVDEIKKQIGAASTPTTTPANFHMINNAIDTVKYVNNADSSTTFYLNNINADSGRFYDAVVNVGKTEVSGPNAFNGCVSYDTFGAVDEYNDALYVAEASLDNFVVNEILQQIVEHLDIDLDGVKRHSGARFDVSNLDYGSDALSFRRVINIDVSESGSNYTVEVKYKYYYSVKQQYQKRSGGNETWQADNIEYVPTDSSKFNKMIYNNSASSAFGTKLENIYFFYYPLYKDAYTGSSTIKIKDSYYDTINLNINAVAKPNIYLYKMFSSSVPDAKYDDYEKNYQPRIQVTGTGSNNYDVKNHASTAHLFWNLCCNVHGGTNDQKITFGTSTLTATHSHPDDHRHGYSSIVNDPFLYDIDIKLFEHGADITTDTPLLTLTGTKNE